ncbi:hypothetical protein ABJI51_41525 [Amycolatopsis sp. NEAU-NG30]|uniref:Band 7 domain-containing protein n=1 Tax=Amycolatopsis melonis TaxID=3156488 RepID=A0ABV0LUM2_9PSEU
MTESTTRPPAGGAGREKVKAPRSEAAAAPPSDGGWQKAAEQNHETTVRTLPLSAYAPIVGFEQVGRLSLLRKRAAHRPWVARVFVKGNGELDVFSWTKQPTTGELVWGGYRSVYDVDLSLRNLSLAITLPSAGDAFVFRTEVDVQWQVKAPETVVVNGLRDIRPLVVPRLLAGLRHASRALAAADVETAEKAANNEFPKDWLLSEQGLWTNILVRLRMDAQTERAVRLDAEVRAFKKLIEQGDLDQFALQLAQNPGNVQAVVEALVAERDTHRKDVLDFVTKLIESDALDRWQIEDDIRVMMQWMQTSIRMVTGTDEARRLPFERPRNGESALPEQDGSPSTSGGA